jgi:hypothetical protein
MENPSDEDVFAWIDANAPVWDPHELTRNIPVPDVTTIKNRPYEIIKVSSCEADMDKTKVVAWNFKTKFFTNYPDHVAMVNHIMSLKPEKRQFVERVYARSKQKLRLDIDNADRALTRDDMKALEDACVVIFTEMFDRLITIHDIIVCDSSNATKQSIHLIIDGYYVRSNELAKQFAEKVKAILLPTHKTLSDSIDLQIYGSAAGLRIGYNSKNGDITHAKRLPEGIDLMRTLITYVEKCMPVGGTPDQVHKEIVQVDNALAAQYAAKILEQVPGFTYRHTRDGTMLFDREVATLCHISGVEHTKDHTLLGFTIGDELYAACRKCIGKIFVCKVDKPLMQSKPKPIKVKRTRAERIKARRDAEDKIATLCKRQFTPKDLTNAFKYNGMKNAHGDYMDEYPDEMPTILVKAAMG